MAVKEGKRVRAAREGIVTKLYPIQDAVKLIKERAKAKFDETIEVSMNLGVDPRHADQMAASATCRTAPAVRCALPYFARGAKADEAQGCRCRHRRRRGALRGRQRRHDRLRPLHRYPGPDAARRPSR